MRDVRAGLPREALARSGGGVAGEIWGGAASFREVERPIGLPAALRAERDALAERLKRM